MPITDPKDVPNLSRIINPNETPEARAVRGLANQQAVEANPIFVALKKDNERMRDDMRMLANQLRSLTTRFHAFIDYLIRSGIMLEQKLDKEGFPVGDPYSAKDSSPMFWENLVDEGLTTMPKYGVEAYLAEHIRLGDFIVQVNQAQIAKAVTMEEVIEQCREFNADPHRLTYIRGDAFGLLEYLNDNPDELTDEELAKLGLEFRLAKHEDEEPITEE
jgi:hypothetical protein